MSGINRRLKRNKKYSMINETVETIQSTILSDKKQHITAYSYNQQYIENSQDLLLKFSIKFMGKFISSQILNEKIFTYSDFFEKCIKNIEMDNSTTELNYRIDDDRVLYNDTCLGIIMGKLSIDNRYIVYWAGLSFFFEDIKTKIKYVHIEEYDSSIMEEE